MTHFLVHDGWILAIAWVGAFYMFGAKRIASTEGLSEDRASGARRLLMGYSAITLAPWILVATGRVTGRVESLVELLHPSSKAPVVVAFWAVVICVSWVASVFVLVKRGRRFVIHHAPVLIRRPLAGWLLVVYGVAGLVIPPAIVALLCDLCSPPGI